MKKGKRTDEGMNSSANNSQSGTDRSADTPQIKPKTFLIMPVSDDEHEAGIVQMTSREIFETNCPGVDPEHYHGLDEAAIYAKMFDRADRLAVMEEKWHPDDVAKVAIACTDFILDALRRNLDMRQIKEGKQSE